MRKNLDPMTAPVVRIDWEDIVFMDNWNEDETVQPQESTTVGYLLEETPTMYVVASSYNWRDRQWGTVHAISRAAPTMKEIE